jgi:glycine hydroxymethyltransferase
MERLRELVDKHSRWRAGECINLIPSENVTSEAVRRLLATDLGHRYTLHSRECPDFPMEYEAFYRGTRYIDGIVELASELANKLFNSRYSFTEALSGHHAGMIVLASLCGRGDYIMALREEDGGYPGYMPHAIPSYLGLRTGFIPFSRDEAEPIYEELAEAVDRLRPRLLIIGASTILFPYRLGEIARLSREYNVLIAYDASHVLGLIAGGEFQPDPLRGGVHILFGSTHKTLFGPQGGIILVNSEELAQRIRRNLKLKMVDNPHINRIAALAQALWEHLNHGREYARQVVRNARALARRLDKLGIPVRYRHKGYTRSHQILLDTRGVEELAGRSYYAVTGELEEANIIVDNAGRLGTQEVTRLGMGEDEMGEIAEMIYRVVAGVEGPERVREEAINLRKRYRGVAYC